MKDGSARGWGLPPASRRYMLEVCTQLSTVHFLVSSFLPAYYCIFRSIRTCPAFLVDALGTDARS